MKWFRDRLAKSWRWVVVSLSLIGAALGIAAAQRSRQDRLSARDRLAVEASLKEVAKLRRERFQALGRSEVRSVEIEALDRDIAASHRAVVAAHKTTEEMTDAQVLEEFRRMGYR